MEINKVKGFRFHPTDEELIEYLQVKTFGRDSLVQVIAELQDICESEPWHLPGRSALQTGDRLWYFMYPPKYKYRNSKRINRTTLEGYWKPTGNARKIINSQTGEIIGSKKTLVFYKGQCNDNNRNKTCWVMHEYELKFDAMPTLLPNHDGQIKTYNLCKLKKKPHISGSGKAGQANQHSLSNLEDCVANRAMLENLLDPNGSSEQQGSNDSGVVHNQSSCIDTFSGERSKQNNVVNEDEGSSLSSSLIHHVAEDAIPKEPLYLLKEGSTEGNGPNEDDWIQSLNSTIKQDSQSCSSVITNQDETASIERSNQENIVVAAEGFTVPSSLECLANEEPIPTDLLYNDGSLHDDELLAEQEASNNFVWIQNHHITNKGEYGEFLNPYFADNTELYLQEENVEYCLMDHNQGFSLPCIGVMEPSNSTETSRKRPRLQYDGLNHHVETGKAHP